MTHTLQWLVLSQLPERESNVSFSKVKYISVINFLFKLILRTAFGRREDEVVFYNSASLSKAPDEQKWVSGGGECSGVKDLRAWCFMVSGFLRKHQKQWVFCAP